MLKIDVEGAEHLVIAGALHTLTTYHPTLIIEFHSIFSAYTCMSIICNYSYEIEFLKKETDGRVMIIAQYTS